VKDPKRLRAKWRRQWHNRQDREKGVTRRRRCGRPRKLTPELEEAFRRSWTEGMTCRAMAAAFDVAPSTVERTARLLNLPRRQVKPPLPGKRPANALPWWVGAE
jgi:hypothetical protein